MPTLTKAHGAPVPKVVPAEVLFVSMHDGSRGPLAANLFNSIVDPRRARARSAGLQPARSLSSFFVAALRDHAGLDISKSQPTFLSSEALRSADLVIALGANGRFVEVGRPMMRWDVALVDTRTPAAILELRDELERLIRKLAASRDWLPDEDDTIAGQA